MPYGSSAGNVLLYLERYGLTDVIIPFLVIFTILFAVLSRVQIFGSNNGQNKKFNVVIALSITLLSIIPHVTGTYRELDIVQIINTTFPQIALIISTIVMVLILVGVVGGGKTAERSPIVSIITVLSIVLIAVIFGRALWPGYTPYWLGFLDDPGLQATLLTLLGFGLVVWFVTSEPPTSGTGGSTTKKWHDIFKELIGSEGSGGGKS